MGLWTNQQIATIKQKNSGIIWRSTTLRVDVDTGEEITKHNSQQNYTKLKTDKHVRLNKDTGRGKIEYTIAYRRKQQIRIQFD